MGKKKRIQLTEAEREWERGFPERMANLREVIAKGRAELGGPIPSDSVELLRKLAERSTSELG